VLATLWPLFDLMVQTSRLELRLPREQEIAELAGIAGTWHESGHAFHIQAGTHPFPAVAGELMRRTVRD
jgi:hypothetical protein